MSDPVKSGAASSSDVPSLGSSGDTIGASLWDIFEAKQKARMIAEEIEKKKAEMTKVLSSLAEEQKSLEEQLSKDKFGRQHLQVAVQQLGSRLDGKRTGVEQGSYGEKVEAGDSHPKGDFAANKEKMANLEAAAADFERYIRNNVSEARFSSVTDQEAPRRRCDGKKLLAARRNYIKATMVWNQDLGRWCKRNGRTLATEDEIWEKIVGELRKAVRSRRMPELKGWSQNSIWDAIKTQFDGIRYTDVGEACRLWEQHCLSLLDASDDSQWTSGSRITILPRDKIVDNASE